MGPIVKPALTVLVALLFIGVSNPQVARSTDASGAQATATDRHTAPARPAAAVELPAEAATGRTIHVKASDSLQAAIDAAAPGDRITLEPRAVYKGPFRLPVKNGNGWIVIASAAEDRLPARGQRVTRADAGQMPRLVAASGSVFEAAAGAHHYRLVGLEISPADGVYLNTLVQLGADEKTIAAQPHHIVVERSYLHGDSVKGARRGVALNSRHSAVVDSRLADFKEVGADSQAISGWNGAGPFLIENNYLEAAGENIMFGGADPATPDLVPADITIVRNHMAKPLRWKKGDPGYEGTDWAVKNLFELKNARRVLVEGNVLEYNWPHAQNGFAILFTVRNQDGGAPWSVIEDVIFVNNIVRHVAGGINMLGRDDIQQSQQTSRISISNNLFVDVGGEWGNGRLFQLLDGTHGVTIDHNTALQTGSLLFGGDHAPHTGFVFQNNIAPHNEHGISGSGTSPGTQTLARYFPRAVVRGNVIIGGSDGQYPTGNTFARSAEDAGIAALRSEDLATFTARPARPGRAGAVAGADLVELQKAVEGVAPAERGEATPAVAVAVPPVAGGLVAAALSDGGPAIAVFWTALTLLFYVYVGYPLVAAVRARVRPRPHVRASITPKVSIVVVAYNEADRIEERITNLLALDYPADQLEIVIGSDGSTDDTVELARKYEPAVRVEAFTTRRGKPAMLNDLVARVEGEIVMFADARQRFEAGTLRTIVANFADPTVGAVSGELIVQPAAGTATAGQGAAFYWRYEKFIRAAESQADSTIGATGAIYAIRRALFSPVPEDTLLDDVLIPLRIVRQGFRVLFEPGARAFDSASASARQEFGRKARTIAGNFQLFSRERWLCDPRENRLWFAAISHKGLRLTVPLLHLALLLSNIAAAHTAPYHWLLAGQIGFYAAALCGCLQQQGRKRFIGFTVPYTLCLMCWSTIVGFYRFVTHQQPITWERTPVAAPVRNRA
jgi:cellulose synthase/poly-beta-1,6-N-acetylglucosamine synthase-like glycosyltransferase